RFADRVELTLQSQLIERSEGQAYKNIEAVREHSQGISERKPNFRFVAGGSRRIGHTPMRRHRVAPPDWGGLLCGVVTDHQYEIELRRARSREFLPAL